MRKQKGFTLVEIILSITLIAILFTVTSIVLQRGLDAYAHISSRAASLQQARYVMERMTRELMRVGDENSTNIQNIQDDQITFVDANNITTNFNFANQTLWREDDLLLPNVTSVTFTGFRDNNNTTSSGQQTRRIRIEFATLPPGETVPLTLRTDVFIRNYLYENYR